MSACVARVSLSVKPFWFVGVYGNCSLYISCMCMHSKVSILSKVCMYCEGIIATSPNGSDINFWLGILCPDACC